MARSLTPAEQRRARLLVVTKRRATGLLVGATAVFLAVDRVRAPGALAGWVQATAVASMVGGLADWFAVTALFRRPLGLPIPHTAIVVERKDRFAETLGSFVQENFLSPARSASGCGRRTPSSGRPAGWPSPDHAAELAGRVADALVAGADLLRDEDVHGLLDGLVRERIDKVALAPLAGRALAAADAGRAGTSPGRRRPGLR